VIKRAKSFYENFFTPNQNQHKASVFFFTGPLRVDCGNGGQYCCRALETHAMVECAAFLFLQPFWYHFVERRKGRAPCSFLPSSPWPWLGLIFSLGIKTLLFFGEQELVIPSSDFDRCNLAIFQLLQSRICTALHTPFYRSWL